MEIKLILNKSESHLPKNPCQVWWFHLVEQLCLRSYCEKKVYRLKTDTKRWQKVTRPLTRRAKYQGRDSQDELLLMLSRRNVT